MFKNTEIIIPTILLQIDKYPLTINYAKNEWGKFTSIFSISLIYIFFHHFLIIPFMLTIQKHRPISEI